MSNDDNNIVALAEERGKRRRPPPGGNPNRPVVRITAGALPQAVDAAEAALVAADHNLFRYGPRLVTIVLDEIKVAGGDKDTALRLSHLTVPALLERFDLAARFEKWDGRAAGYVPCHCPRDIAERYLARDGKWRVLPLLGIVTAPTLRADGSILATPGYDEDSGLFFDPMGIEFPAVPDLPTRAEALEALGRIKAPLAEFAFVNEASRAVALSAVLTAVARRSLDTAPLHGFDAPVAGSGKSKLIDFAVIVASGHRCAVNNVEEVLWKQLATALLAGHDSFSLDNMIEPVGGALLNQVLTQFAIAIRTFGKLENVTVPCCMTIFANGNNLLIEGDTTRRALVGKLDPRVERPELLEFTFDPVTLAGKNRAALLVDALTVLRAWIVADDRPAMPPPLGSFERWSHRVRCALIWLGESDPCDVMEEVRGADPHLLALRGMMLAWSRVIGVDRWVKVSEVVAQAVEKEKELVDGKEVDTAKHKNADLHEAVQSVVKSGEWAKSLGWWLRNNRDRVVTIEDFGKVRFFQSHGLQMSIWMLQMMEPMELTADVEVADVPL